MKRRWGMHGSTNGIYAAAISLMVGLVVGCEKASAPAADLSKTPWLDAKVQKAGLKDSDMRIRGVSAINLGIIGASAADAIPELEKLASNDPEPKVRENAAKAIEKNQGGIDAIELRSVCRRHHQERF